ncbi:MAG: SH3 domain-containing protein [Thermomicrobia bacterium]|nr:SH3 domain-containing protein [Thermomicrobia bacterium]MCA1722655.1 SH3 domain-containing protein [Thermomicrobia bacterium]
MRRVWWLLVAFVLTGCAGVGTPTPGRPSPATPVPTVVASSPTSIPALPATAPSASPTSARAVAPPTPTAIVPQVVTVKEDAVNVRDSASMDAPAFATLDNGTELSVLGPDTTGPDGATRWVHVTANGRDGYVRSDLVSVPRAYASPTPVPPTPIPPTAVPDYYADYPLIDAGDWAKRPDAYIGKHFSVTGEAFNVHESGGATTFQVFAETSLGRTVAVAVVFRGTTSRQEGSKVRVFGVGVGTITGTNAFNGTVTNPTMDAVYITSPTPAKSSSEATAYVRATANAFRQGLNDINATGAARQEEIQGTHTARMSDINATLTAIPRKSP